MKLKSSLWLNRTTQILLGLIFCGLFVFFLYKQRTELESLKSIILQSNYLYLGLGVFLTFCYLVVQALFYQTCLSVIHKSLPLRVSLALFLKRFFIGSFLPAGFTVSQYTFTAELKNYSISKLDNHLASTIYLLVGALSYTVILVPTILYLLWRNELITQVGYGSAILIVIVLYLIWQFYLAFRQKGLLYTLLIRFLPDLPDFLVYWQKNTLDYGALLGSFFLALAVDFAGVSLLLAAFAAFQLPISLTLAFIGYVLTILILTVSPYFEGLGLVEFSLVYVLKEFGISASNAVAVTLIYRLYQLWIPFIIGFIVLTRERLRGLAQTTVDAAQRLDLSKDK